MNALFRQFQPSNIIELAGVNPEARFPTSSHVQLWGRIDQVDDAMRRMPIPAVSDECPELVAAANVTID